MIIHRLFKRFAAAVTVAAMATTAQAALFDRGNGMIYDDHSNITWLADFNYAQTSGHTGTGVSAGGRMTWDAAVAWADSLSYGGYSDWRLPTIDPSDASCSQGLGTGYNCTGGELGHLFVVDLGNQASQSVLNQTGDTTQQLANQALFSNVQSFGYWSATEYAPAATSAAWLFDAGFGRQDPLFKGFEGHAVAVRPGDVLPAVTPVPEPQTWLLMMLGLGAVASAVKRKAV